MAARFRFLSNSQWRIMDCAIVYAWTPTKRVRRRVIGRSFEFFFAVAAAQTSRYTSFIIITHTVPDNSQLIISARLGRPPQRDVIFRNIYAIYDYTV